MIFFSSYSLNNQQILVPQPKIKMNLNILFVSKVDNKEMLNKSVWI